MKKGVDYIGVGVGAIIFDKHKRVFLALRGPKSKNEPGKWNFPGGTIEFGETSSQTIIREMKEEFGIIVKPLQMLDAADHIIPEEKQHWIALGYIAKITKGTPVILEPEKCTAIGWFTLPQVKRLPLTISTKIHLKSLKKFIL